MNEQQILYTEKWFFTLYAKVGPTWSLAFNQLDWFFRAPGINMGNFMYHLATYFYKQFLT